MYVNIYWVYLQNILWSKNGFKNQKLKKVCGNEENQKLKKVCGNEENKKAQLPL